MASYAARTKELFRKYGRVAVGVHFAVYFTGLGACYVAVERGVKVDKFLRSWGLMGEKKERGEGGSPSVAGGGGGDSTSTSSSPSPAHEEEDDGRNWFARALSGRGSSLALAFVANKALFPVRAPITLGLTPAVARALRANASSAAARSAAAARGAAGEASASESSVGNRNSLKNSGGSGSGGGSSAVSDT